jgi:TRAP-type mannitol/chloroaromatic compound transport system permease small subunit
MNVAVVAINCPMIFIRIVLNGSTGWQTEAVIYLAIRTPLIGLPYVQRLRGHVNVDLIPLFLGAFVAAGSIAAGRTLGTLIPPSVTMIVYGIATETSIVLCRCHSRSDAGCVIYSIILPRVSPLGCRTRSWVLRGELSRIPLIWGKALVSKPVDGLCLHGYGFA